MLWHLKGKYKCRADSVSAMHSTNSALRYITEMHAQKGGIVSYAKTENKNRIEKEKKKSKLFRLVSGIFVCFF